LKTRLLVVDDDLLVRDMAVRSLRHAGFDVTDVDSGEAALAAFERAPFDLLLLDVVMRGIDGFETCRRLRRMEHGHHVPVLILTGLDDTDSIEEAQRAGATDFITKPIHWGLLVYRVRYALRGAEAWESIRQSRESMARAQQMAHLGNWSLEDGGVMGCSEELARIFGAPPEAAQCASAEAFLQRVSEADRDRVRAARDALVSRGQPYQLTFTIERFDGITRTVFEQATPVRDAVGRQVAVEGITHDISERVDAERRIQHMALHDGLTGLPNREFFVRLAARALEAARHGGTLCAVLQIDLDRFKSINDALGNDAGNEVLRIVAQRLQHHLRVGDLTASARAATQAGVLARVGGNAFTVLLVDIGRPDHAARASERLAHAVAEPMAVADSEVRLTASVGMALFPRDATDPDQLIRFAEQALYAAKAAGPGQHRFFDEAMNAQASARLARESELRRAIAGGELRLYLQPKIVAASGALQGAEALVRWQHPERGLLPPSEFIALAEETGQIQALTAWVLDEVCALSARCAHRGLPGLPLAVNVAAPCFMAEDLIDDLVARVRRHGMSPAGLVLEVTESMLMTDLDRAVGRLHALHDQGFKLSLDDFGTGYSSLAYLKRFPIDELKIDRSFVVDVDRSDRDGALIAAILTLAQLMQMQVVAEGVETAAQAAALQRLGCGIHQGYLYARPMPASDFEALLARRAADEARHAV
jgi:diguanylate cyclase (GGDEF)-like protein/PAS domain S-box-containing protein